MNKRRSSVDSSYSVGCNDTGALPDMISDFRLAVVVEHFCELVVDDPIVLSIFLFMVEIRNRDGSGTTGD